ncbi:hypothetical protein PG5_15200 [Pseudomonas sp. G5(2012)]|nr:hypothetical protein PG5_15200 [Pseudomonas sp. G5(2012)]
MSQRLPEVSIQPLNDSYRPKLCENACTVLKSALLREIC